MANSFNKNYQTGEWTSYQSPCRLRSPKAPGREGLFRRRFFRGLFRGGWWGRPTTATDTLIGPEWCLSHYSQTSRQSQQMA